MQSQPPWDTSWKSMCDYPVHIFDTRWFGNKHSRFQQLISTTNASGDIVVFREVALQGPNRVSGWT